MIIVTENIDNYYTTIIIVIRIIKTCSLMINVTDNTAIIIIIINWAGLHERRRTAKNSILL